MHIPYRHNKSYQIALMLVLLSVIAMPRTSYAQGYPVYDAQAALTQASLSVQNIGKSALESFKTNFEAALGIRDTQALVDATDKATLTASEMKLEDDYYTPTDANGNADNGVCAETEGAGAGAAVNASSQSLGNTLGSGSQQTSGGTPSQKLSQACNNGNIDKSVYPDLAKAAGNCNYDNGSVINDRRDADINYASVDNDDMMEMPKGISFTGGVMIMPDNNAVAIHQGTAVSVNSLPAHQKSFIDAYNMCVNKNGMRPANIAASGNTTITTAVLGSYEQRMETLARSPSFISCTNEITRNTAISAEDVTWYGGADGQTALHNISATGLKNPFAIQYANEVKKCDTLTTLGVTDPVLTNCATAGISPAKIEELETARFDSPNFVNNLVTMRNLTPDEKTMVTEQHTDSATIIRILRDIADNVKIIAANTQPKNGEPSRAGTDQPVAAKAP